MMDKQTILIAGATGNVGGGASFSLARRGAKVVLLGRKPKTLEARADAIRTALSEEGITHQPSDVEWLVVDFTDMDDVRRAAEEALERFPRIDGMSLSAATLVQGERQILPNGHELMFATSVMGPFLFTHMLLDRLERSHGLVVQVIAPFHEEMDWDDIESLKEKRTVRAYNRTKTCEQVVAAELARRYAGRVSSVAYHPGFVIDKENEELKEKWPKGLLGLFWSMLTFLIAKPPSTAGEPLADIMLEHEDRSALNGAVFKRGKRLKKRYKAMDDEEFGKKLWDELVVLTEIEGE